MCGCVGVSFQCFVVFCFGFIVCVDEFPFASVYVHVIVELVVIGSVALLVTVTAVQLSVAVALPNASLFLTCNTPFVTVVAP